MRYAEVVEATRRILGEYTYRLTVRQVYYRLISPPYQLFPNTTTSEERRTSSTPLKDMSNGSLAS